MELDKEEILNELMNFEKNYGRDSENGLPEYLERLLINIAKSGDTIYPWNKIKPVILRKIELVVNEFNTKYPYENNPVLPNVKPFNFQEMKDEIIEKFEYFNGAPFTIQRICELLTAPYKYYKRSDKFMRGLEKNVRVISTIEARRADAENEPESFQREFLRSPHNNNTSSSSSFAFSSNILLSSPLPSSSSSSSISPSSSSSSSASSSQLSSIASSSASSSAFMNGLNEKEESSTQAVLCSNQMSQSCSPLQDSDPLPNSPAPLQQLDSFTTVFASPPSTPLAVVSDIHPYDAGSPSSSSSSSSESSPQPSSSSSPPPSLTSEASEANQSSDVELEESKLHEDSNVNKSIDNSNESVKSDDEQTSIMEQEEPMKQIEEEKVDIKQGDKLDEKQNENQNESQAGDKQNDQQNENQADKVDDEKVDAKDENEKQNVKLNEIQEEKAGEKPVEMQDKKQEEDTKEKMQEMQEEKQVLE